MHRYFHCDKCVACLPLSMRGAHKCIQESLRVDCPVCLEFLHNSLRTASILPCGHALHTDCRTALLRQGSPRCPICNHSMVDMAEQWRQMDEMVRQTPMPEEYRAWQVEILCADCQETSTCVFHVVGLKCGGCGGYNTARTGSEPPPQAGAAPGDAAADESTEDQGAAQGGEAHGDDGQ
jgi:RING finger/CHY zinc finger protein 1